MYWWVTSIHTDNLQRGIVVRLIRTVFQWQTDTDQWSFLSFHCSSTLKRSRPKAWPMTSKSAYPLVLAFNSLFVMTYRKSNSPLFSMRNVLVFFEPRTIGPKLMSLDGQTAYLVGEKKPSIDPIIFHFISVVVRCFAIFSFLLCFLGNSNLLLGLSYDVVTRFLFFVIIFFLFAFPSA